MQCTASLRSAALRLNCAMAETLNCSKDNDSSLSLFLLVCLSLAMFQRILRVSSIQREFGRRSMGGGHHHAPPKDGLDGMVRKYLPEDQHVSFLSFRIHSLTISRLYLASWASILLFIYCRSLCLEARKKQKLSRQSAHLLMGEKCLL